MFVVIAILIHSCTGILASIYDCFEQLLLKVFSVLISIVVVTCKPYADAGTCALVQNVQMS